ncbi:MAG: hypothetical protein KBC46_03470 [Ferrovibrio sp.]|nr:hypothetical protein [Ferrovibrio sp.]
MGLRITAVERTVRLGKEHVSPERVGAALASLARAELEKAIAAGEGTAEYETYVNGRAGAALESVRPPGPIVFVFAWLGPVVEFATTFLRQRYAVRGPAAGGHYQDSHRVLIDGRAWSGGSIPSRAEVTIVNTQPYARKVQIGARGFEVARGIYDDAEKAVRQRYGRLVICRTRFVSITDPYLLRYQGYRLTRSGRPKARKDMRAGTALTYPALVIALREPA